MSKVIMWSDLHLGHDNAIRWRTKFNTPEEHHETILEALFQRVQKRDVVYLLGDIAITLPYLHRLRDTLCCQQLHIILGNHDTEKKRGQQMFVREWLKADHVHVHSLMKYHGFWLSHAPIHPDELRGCRNIHGHTHDHRIQGTTLHYRWNGGEPRYFEESEDDSRYINICPEQTDYQPVVFQELLKRINV